MDYRSLYDKDYIGAWDIQDGDWVIKITKVIGGQLTSVGGRKSKKPVVYFEGSEKGFALNATNGKSIAGMYGNHVEKWVGKRIALFKSMTRSPDGSGDVECLRVRPNVPPASGKQAAAEMPLKFADDAQNKKFARASDWLTAFEQAIAASADKDVAGQLWDLNNDVFYEIQAAMQKAENAAAIDRCNAVGKMAQERMSPPVDQLL